MLRIKLYINHHNHGKEQTWAGTRCRPCWEDPRPPRLPAGSPPTCKGFTDQQISDGISDQISDRIMVALTIQYLNSQSNGQSQRRKATGFQVLVSTLVDGVGSCLSATSLSLSSWKITGESLAVCSDKRKPGLPYLCINQHQSAFNSQKDSLNKVAWMLLI